MDDSDTVRQAYASHFRQSGFEVECAGSLKEAAEHLAGAPFDAAIVDVSLSAAVAGEGLAIAAYLRQMRCGPAVVVLTAYGQPHQASAAARLEVDAFLHKPVSLVWLEHFLRSRLEGRPGEPNEVIAAAV